MLWKETQTCSKIVYLSTDFVFDLIEIIYFNPKLVKACLYIHVGITGACIYIYMGLHRKCCIWMTYIEAVVTE